MMFLMGMIVREAKRYPFWYIILKTLVNLIGHGNHFDPITYWQYMILFAVIILERTISSTVLLSKLKKHETNWSNKAIERLKINSKTEWKKISLYELKIGDIIRLREDAICPCDLLILDSSQHRYNDRIIFANEAKLTGKTKIKIKVAIKGIRETSQRINSESGSEDELKNLIKALNGYIEYNPPDANMYVIKGHMKFKHDPKMHIFSNNNIMFFGSKLNSEWVIGMVLYTGKNVQSLKKNFKPSDLTSIYIKGEQFLKRRLNTLTAWVFLASIIIAVLFTIMLHMNSTIFERVQVIEDFTFGTISSSRL
jgi:magnesium-transporting ATPase (P-type)